jgi:hypothetical protein
MMERESKAAGYAGDLSTAIPETHSSSLAAAYRQLLKIHRQPAKRRLTIRLTGPEIAGLTRAAAGESVSIAVQTIVTAYLRNGPRHQPREKSVAKTTLFLTPALLQELRQVAADTGSTPSEIIHAALRDAFEESSTGE